MADDAILPPLPPPDANGRFPAVEYSRISLARNLIRDRKSVGLRGYPKSGADVTQ